MADPIRAGRVKKILNDLAPSPLQPTYEDELSVQDETVKSKKKKRRKKPEDEENLEVEMMVPMG